MRVEIAVIDSIAEVSAADFERLDTSAGAVGSYQRISQREADGRWLTRYLRCLDGDRLLALIPLHTAQGTSWPDPVYDPTGWPLPVTDTQDCQADSCLLVGSNSDLLTGLPVAAELRAPEPLRALLARIARLAADEGRCLAFPFHYSSAQQAIDRAGNGAIRWALLGREARLEGLDDPGWEAGLSRPARYNLRHDRALIEAAGIRSSIVDWAEVAEPASALIAEHNVRVGMFDHPEFVKLRGQRWQDCPGVEFLVFAAESDTLTGYVTGWVWRDELAVYEIGLPGPESPERLACYLELVFRRPIQLAQQRGLRMLRLGPTAERIKAGRGAVFHELFGGVLDVVATKHLAGG
ncbi:MAG TPA: hypothetical protein VH298_17375 [Jatrophihabitans sp.]|nr:hypothetical protein [Jatrophihabitans sp.]